MSSISRKIKFRTHKIKQSDVLIISWAIFSIVLAIFLLRGIIWEPGLPQTRDLVFPYNMSSTFNHQLSTWNDIHSQRNFELNKIPIYWVFKTGSNLLGSENMVKTFLILVLFSLNFFIFISLLTVFKSKVKSTTLLAVICGIPSLFYVFNPWVVDRISNHIFMVFGMSLTPILVIMYIKMLEKGGSFFRYLLVATVLTIISMTSTHNIFYVIPLIIFSGLFYTIFSKNKRKILLDNILFFMMYVLLNSFWILPVGYEFSQASIGPSYSSLNIEKLSELNTPSNLLRFIGGGAWIPVLEDPPLASLSIYLSFLTIFFSLCAIFLFPKNIFVLLLGVLFCILFIFSLGTNSPFPLYEWLATTVFSGILWLYRDPSRLIQYMIMVCSILLAFTLYRVTSSSFTRFRKVRSSLPYIIMASILVSPAMFTFLNEGGGRLVSQELPPHYNEVYNFFSKDTNDDYKVLWLPLRQYFDYNWSNKSDVAADIYSLSSPQSTYRISTESSVNNTLLLRYIVNKLLLEYRTNEIGLYLRLYDIKYVVVHSDLEGALANEPQKALKILGFQKDMKLLKQEGPYYIFENLHYDINAGKFLVLHEEQNIEELTSLPPSNKTRDAIAIDDLQLWNKSENSQVSLDRKRGESVVKWQSMLNSSQNESDVRINLNNTNIEPFNKLEIKIFADRKNKDQQLRVILYTNTSQFPLLPSVLLPGKWNKLSFDLRDVKILAAETGQELNFKNITGIGMQLSNQANIEKNENYPLHIDTISFSNSTFGPYDPSKIINKWMDKLNQNVPLKFIKEGPTRYILTMNSSKEFILGFVEPFDPLWVIRYQDNTGFKEHKSVPLFASINGYHINRTTGHEIELVHKPAELQDVGKIITISTLFSTVGYLLWKHLTHYGDKWRKLMSKRINSAEPDK